MLLVTKMQFLGCDTIARGLGNASLSRPEFLKVCSAEPQGSVTRIEGFRDEDTKTKQTIIDSICGQSIMMTYNCIQIVQQ